MSAALSPEVLAKYQALADEGLNMTEAARVLGVSKVNVRRVSLAYGIHFVRRRILPCVADLVPPVDPAIDANLEAEREAERRRAIIIANCFQMSSLITPEIEGYVGRAMLEDARKSGQRSRLPGDGGYQKLTPLALSERRAQASEMALAGMTVTQIAAQLGCGYDTIRGDMRRMGLL